MKKSEVEMLLAMIKRDCEHEYDKPLYSSHSPNSTETSSSLININVSKNDYPLFISFGKGTTYTASYRCEICGAYKSEPYYPKGHKKWKATKITRTSTEI